MRKLVFKLQKKQLPDYDPCHNYLGFDSYEVIQLNYDGKGNHLVFEDGRLSYIVNEDFLFVMFSGWYKLVK